jgi:hypothetical protein
MRRVSSPAATARPLVLLVCAGFVCAPLAACLEPPELDELEPPPLFDLGGVDTWGPLDHTPIPSFDEGEEPEPDTETGGAPAPADPALAQLLLTEALVDPEGKDGGVDSPEFVELFNPGPDPATLDGLRIAAESWPALDATELGLAGVSLAPGAWLVVWRFASEVDPDLAQPDITAQVVSVGFVDSGGLRNADGRIEVFAGADLVDELVYGAELDEPSSGWVGMAVDGPGSGQSMCRGPDPSDTNSAADWVLCVPNPGQHGSDAGGEEPSEPTPIPAGAIQIVEVSANPPGSASEEKPYEFIEILNTSENELELTGCTIGDDPSPDAPGVDPLEYLSGDGGCASLTCLAPGRRAIIVGQGYAGPVGAGLVLATDDSTIADGGLTNTEPAVLRDALGTQVSSYRLWPDPSGEPLPSDEQPLHRIDPAAPDEPQSWVSAPPTPGE